MKTPINEQSPAAQRCPTTDLYLGDAIDHLRQIEDSTVNLILTDPPYNLGQFMIDRSAGIHRMRKNFFVSAGWDNLNSDDWENSMREFLRESTRVLAKNGSMIIFMSAIKVETIVRLAVEVGLYYKTTGIWHKTNPMPRNMNLHFVNSTESWIYFVNRTRTGTFNNENKVIHDFIETSQTPPSEKKHGSHPTQKPLKLLTHFIEILSNPGDLVVDPFMGSGSTGVAARLLGRDFIGVEMNEEYFEIAKRRNKETLL